MGSEMCIRDRVRLVLQAGEQAGVVSFAEALAEAQKVSLDLVKINDDEPPVCKIMDYGKHVFEQKKKKHAAKKKQKATHLKEIKFRPGTEEGDYQVKLRNLIRFIEKGDKVKVTVKFRGREMAHQEIGLRLLARIEQDVAEITDIEQNPTMDRRQLTMLLSSKRKK